MSLKYNIVLDKGSDFALIIKVKNKSGNLINFLNSGTKIVSHVKKTPLEQDPIDKLTVENGRIALNTDSFKMWFPHNATGSYDITSGVYDVIYIDAESGMHIRLLEGSITVKNGVTKLVYTKNTATSSTTDTTPVVESKEIIVEDISKENFLGDIDVDTSENTFIEGMSAYGVAVKNGYTGTEAQWLQSLKADIEISAENTDKYLSNDGSILEWREIPWQEIETKIDTQVNIINTAIATNKENIETKLSNSATILNSSISELESHLTSSATIIGSRIDNIAEELSNDYLPITGGTMTGIIMGTASNALNAIYSNFSGTASYTSGTAVYAVNDSNGKNIDSTYLKIEDAPTKVSQFENDATYQTEQQVKDAINGVINGAGEALDTLKELADALGNDPDFATTVTNNIATKAPIYHATVEQTYGVGNASLYGHLKLSSTLSDFSEQHGIAATPLLVKSAKESVETTLTNSAILLNSAISLLNSNVDITNSTIDANKTDIETKLTNSADTINSSIGTLDTKLTNSAIAINSSILTTKSDIETIITNSTTVINSTIESNKVDIETKLSDSSTLINSRITVFGEITDQMFENVENTATDRYNLFSTALTQNFDILNSTIGANKTDIETKLTNSSLAINSSISSVNTSLATTRTELETLIGNSSSVINDNIGLLSSATNSSITSLDTKLTNSATLLNSAISALDSHLTNSATIIGSRIDNIANELTNDYLPRVGGTMTGVIYGTVTNAISDASGNNIVDTYATKAALKQSVDDLVNGASEALDTLKELSNALGDDPNFATTVTNNIATKAPIYHASTATDYGVGNSTLYGHLKLSSAESDLDVSDGTAATPLMVKTAHIAVNSAIASNKEDIETKLTNSSLAINSSIEVSSSAINSTISANKTDIETKLTNSSSAINSSIATNVDIINSSISDNVQTLNSTISANKTDIETKLTNSSSAINSSIATNKTDIETKLTNSSTALNSSINRESALLNSAIRVLSSSVSEFRGDVQVLSDTEIDTIWNESANQT